MRNHCQYKNDSKLHYVYGAQIEYERKRLVDGEKDMRYIRTVIVSGGCMLHLPHQLSFFARPQILRVPHQSFTHGSWCERNAGRIILIKINTTPPDNKKRSNTALEQVMKGLQGTGIQAAT
jgi:hypothetical protein